jgi:hypothetical protein
MASAVAIVITVTIVMHHNCMVMVMTDCTVTSGFFGLPRRHVAVAPADFLAVLRSPRGCGMVDTNDVAVVAIMVAAAVTVVMTDIVTIMVMAFAVVVPGESVATQSKRQSEKRYKMQPVHTHLIFDQSSANIEIPLLDEMSVRQGFRWYVYC